MYASKLWIIRKYPTLLPSLTMIYILLLLLLLLCTRRMYRIKIFRFNWLCIEISSWWPKTNDADEPTHTHICIIHTRTFIYNTHRLVCFAVVGFHAIIAFFVNLETTIDCENIHPKKHIIYSICFPRVSSRFYPFDDYAHGESSVRKIFTLIVLSVFRSDVYMFVCVYTDKNSWNEHFIDILFSLIILYNCSL